MPRLYTAVLISLLVFNLLGVQILDAQQPESPPAKLHINVVEGDAQLVNIKSRVNPAPVIEVLDENNKPVQGAVVSFFLPGQGPGGTFSNGANNTAVITDRNGRMVGALQVSMDDEVMLMSQSGVLVRTPVKEISVVGRNTQGVRLIRLEEGDQLSGLDRIAGEPGGGDAAAEGGDGEADDPGTISGEPTS